MGSFGKNGRQKGKKEVGPEALLGGKVFQFYNLPNHVAKAPPPLGRNECSLGQECKYECVCVSVLNKHSGRNVTGLFLIHS